MADVYVGQPVTLRAECRRFGRAVDATPTFVVRSPTGVRTIITSSSVVNGGYETTFTPDIDGEWMWSFEDTSSGAYLEAAGINVRKRAV